MNKQIQDKLSKLPKSSGVYIMRNIDGQVIYVGKAKNLKNRVSQYFNRSQKHLKVQAMVDNIYDFDYYLALNERDAFALENNLIKQYQPFYNILLKDGKQYPYIKINLKADYPSFEVTRKILKDGAKYFGPYISGINPYELIKIISFAFQIRTCRLNLTGKRPQRECLNYFLGNCNAPCTNRITKEEYRLQINKAIDFLNGNDSTIEKVLTEKMLKNAEKENFESALEIKNMISVIKKIKEKVVSSLPKNSDIDLFAYFTDGKSAAVSQMVIRGGKTLGINTFSIIDASLTEEEALSSYLYQYYEKAIPTSEIITNARFEDDTLENYLSEKANKKVSIKFVQKGAKHNLIKLCENNAKEHIERNTSLAKRNYDKTIGALNNLKEKLNLSKIPKRIECYDISNLSGTNVVSSMVVMTNGKIDKNQYRKFKIKTVEGQNDFACMEETINRRFARLKENDVSFSLMPDLVVIDGGKGQLSSAIKALNNQGIKVDIISLAERLEEVYKPDLAQPIRLKYGSVELNLLQTIRDEAHRFAITFHRKTRDKKMLSSPLDEIKGIGKVKKANLLKIFLTSDNVAKASIEDLSLIKGIDKNLAKNIYDYFHKQKEN